MMRLNPAGTWTLTRVRNGEAVPAQVCGDTHSALLAAGRIAAPYVGCNELDAQWVGREDWRYSRTFTVGREWLAMPSVFLHCESMDTLAEIRINGRLAGRTENQFTRYRFEVKPFLTAGENRMEILFRSAENRARALAGKLPEVAVGTEQHLLTGSVERFPEFGVPGDDDVPVEIGMDERSGRPDEVVVLDDYRHAGLGPRAHVMEREPEETVEHFSILPASDAASRSMSQPNVAIASETIVL